jgi:aminoglycoside 2'-N-acetyltransferase I
VTVPDSMTAVDVRHTAFLDSAELRAIRALLGAAFEDGISDDDFDHALGGLHTLVWEDRELVAHGSVILRRLLHEDRAVRTGYVEAVAVHPDHRRRGHAHRVMAALENVIRGAYQLGALGASDAGARLYEARGWQRWRGTTSVIAPSGRRRTPDDDGAVYVLPVDVRLTMTGDLTCEWREGDVW